MGKNEGVFSTYQWYARVISPNLFHAEAVKAGPKAL
jgi:hypothetical protein